MHKNPLSVGKGNTTPAFLWKVGSGQYGNAGRVFFHSDKSSWMEFHFLQRFKAHKQRLEGAWEIILREARDAQVGEKILKDLRGSLKG